MNARGRIRLLAIRNFRSIAKAELRLRDLTILVGPNGAGKSNVLDALRFASDALSVTPGHALSLRGGVGAVRRKGLRGHPNDFTIRLEVELPNQSFGIYAFTVGALPKGEFSIKHEVCVIHGVGALDRFEFEIEEGRFKLAPRGLEPRISHDRLALTAVSAKTEFRPMYDFLAGMEFYNLVPELMRRPQDPDPGLVLKRDGSNAAAVVRELRAGNGELREVCDFLQRVVPGMNGVERIASGTQETLLFKQDVGDPKGQPLTFLPPSISDGTLRVLGVLLAIYQRSRPPLLGIEEPESTVHPAAAEVLFDVIQYGTRWSQVIVTTHSPELVEHKDVKIEDLRAVEMERGETVVTELDEPSKEAIRRRLCTPGDLLRNGHMKTSAKEYQNVPDEPNLFSTELTDGSPNRDDR
ncbi:MAG: AAA family ATPase [Planctomycetota bacterium]